MEFISKTFSGLEEILADELRKIGAGNVTAARRAVYFSGDKSTLYRINYLSRLSVSVLRKIAGFSIKDDGDLYRKSLDIEWEAYMSPSDTFSVVPVVDSGIFRHSGFAGLRLKDAIADYFRKKRGIRPSVDRESPDITVNLHISGNRVTVSLDSSGEPLFKRGYRKGTGDAPLNEVLAAALIILSGWKPDDILIDPMCGSGTILTEAVMNASSIPSGYFRKSYGFMRWKDYDEALFSEIRERSNKEIKVPGKINVKGYDISEEAVNTARRNIKAAGLEEIISVGQKDFMELHPEGSSGYLIFNPPYGERMNKEDLTGFYERIGQHLKYHYGNYTACILSPSEGPVRRIGLKPSARYRLYNGPIECYLLVFELYEGSKKLKNRNIT
ncbi:MAG: methyltransferase [Bacteroidales bacterium]|nr:methyltransferase [Bacteroidales bacterium]